MARSTEACLRSSQHSSFCCPPVLVVSPLAYLFPNGLFPEVDSRQPWKDVVPNPDGAIKGGGIVVNTTKIAVHLLVER